ncbi:MAG: hypothetical protein H7Y60_14560 [Rhodospirillaceae bacterium]|nr:hypothetical protein [Rhodospirillales bacterium]
MMGTETIGPVQQLTALCRLAGVQQQLAHQPQAFHMIRGLDQQCLQKSGASRQIVGGHAGGGGLVQLPRRTASAILPGMAISPRRSSIRRVSRLRN